jgi:hypothetical protein
MGRVERRETELEIAAVAYYQRKISLKELCDNALKYATAVFHNRKSRDKNKLKKQNPINSEQNNG